MQWTYTRQYKVGVTLFKTYYKTTNDQNNAALTLS